MENFSKEIIRTITEDYADDTRLVISMLSYLYQTTSDEQMKLAIIEVFNNENWCIECGDEMTLFHFYDDNGNVQVAYDCLRCSDREVE